MQDYFNSGVSNRGVYNKVENSTQSLCSIGLQTGSVPISVLVLDSVLDLHLFSSKLQL